MAVIRKSWWAGRLQIDFWDPENGYYLNGTYYGDKNLLAIAVATQVQADRTGTAKPTATTVDFLFEKKVLEWVAQSQSKVSSPITTVSVDITGVMEMTPVPTGSSRFSNRRWSVLENSNFGKYAIAEASRWSLHL